MKQGGRGIVSNAENWNFKANKWKKQDTKERRKKKYQKTLKNSNKRSNKCSKKKKKDTKNALKAWNGIKKIDKNFKKLNGKN